MKTPVNILAALFTLGLCGPTVECPGQTNSYLHYSIPEGLPSSEVYQVYQDKAGFIWFASDNGVVRFDGNEMKTYQPSEGLSDPVVFGFDEDAKGRLWFRTYSAKLSYFQNGKVERYQFNDSISAHVPGYLNAMHVDTLGQVWFGTYGLFGKVNADGRVETRNIDRFDFIYNRIENGAIMGARNLPHRVKNIVIDDQSFPIQISDTTTYNLVYSAVQCKEKIYFALNTNIFEYDGKSVNRVLEADDAILSLSVDLEYNVWVGYRNRGVDRFEHGDFRHPANIAFLNGKSVTKVLEDHQHGHWFSTLQDGVYYVPDFKLLNYDNPTSSKIKVVVAAGKTTLVGDDKGILSILDNHRNVIQTKQLEGKAILAIFQDSRNNFWVSTTQTTYLFDSLFRIKRLFPNLSIGDFSEDINGHIWSVSGLLVTVFDSTGNIAMQVYTPTMHRSISFIGSMIIMAEKTGLDFYDEKLKELNIPDHFKNYKVSKVVEFAESKLLIATIGSGFFVLDMVNWTYDHYDADRGFVSNNIYALIKVDSTVWLGTEKGIAITSIRALLNKNPLFKLLTRKSGLASEKINFLCHSNQSVLAFYENYFADIPKYLQTPINPPLFYLKNVLVNNQMAEIRLHQLPYDQNEIQINFGFISYKNQYIFLRSRLSKNSLWSYTKERNLKFYALAPGDYTFELEYSLDNNRWIPVNTDIQFSISPPWWRAWYFQGTLLVVIMGIGYVFFRNRIAILRHKHHYLKTINDHQQNLIRAEVETLDKERTRIAKDLHDSIGMNLTAIKMSVNRLLKKYNDPNAALVEDQLQHTIKDIKDIIYNLTPPGLERYGLESALRNYIEKIKDHLDAKIELHAFGNEITDVNLSLPSFRIIQELIGNSLKHAGARLIVIHINKFDDLLSVVYEDDGIGFNSNTAVKGAGLYNIQSRIEAIHGKLKFESGKFGVSYSIDIPISKQTKN